MYTLIEDWNNQQAHTLHIDGLIKSGDWAKIEAMLAGEPTSSFVTQV